MVSSTFERICELVKSGEVRISEHGYEEMSQENILARDVVAGVPAGIVVEDYPNYAKGPCVLVLERDHDGMALHVVWGTPKNLNSPAVVVTAYRPDPSLWSDDYLRRKA